MCSSERDHGATLFPPPRQRPRLRPDFAPRRSCSAPDTPATAMPMRESKGFSTGKQREEKAGATKAGGLVGSWGCCMHHGGVDGPSIRSDLQPWRTGGQERRAWWELPSCGLCNWRCAAPDRNDAAARAHVARAAPVLHRPSARSNTHIINRHGLHGRVMHPCLLLLSRRYSRNCIVPLRCVAGYISAFSLYI